MSEGLLYKKIDEAEVKDIDEVFHEYTIVNIKDVKEILDEAKDDLIKTYCPVFENPTVENYEFMLDVWRNWFQKWFEYGVK